MSADGFRVLAASAWVCRHVFSKKIAAGRPDDSDRAKMETFADEVVKRLTALDADGSRYSAKSGLEGWKCPVIRSGEPVAPYYVPKGEDGNPAKFLKA